MTTYYFPPSKETLSRQAGIIGLTITLLLLTGCTIVSQNKAFPSLHWYWSKDAKLERYYRKQNAEYDAQQKAAKQLGEALAKEWGSESKTP